MRKYFLFLFLVFVLVSCQSVIVQDYKLPYQTVTLNKNEKQCIKIIHLSDLHSEDFGEHQSTLINLIKDSSPDLVVLTGDIFDSLDLKLGTQNIEYLLEFLKDYCPFIYVTGNHEYMDKRSPDYKKIVSSYGGIVLGDEVINLKVKNVDLLIAGMNDPFVDNLKSIYIDEFKEKYIERIGQVFYNLEDLQQEVDSSNDFTILLAHRPEFIKEYSKYNYDLILSGHAHGGQWRLPPFINGLYASRQGFFPKYAGGKYKISKNHFFFVSRGLTVYHPDFPRIFNNPEVVEISIIQK